MNYKTIIFSTILIAVLAFFVADVINGDDAKQRSDDNAVREQVAIESKNLVLLSDDKPVKQVLVDSNKERLASNDNSLQIWVE